MYQWSAELIESIIDGSDTWSGIVQDNASSASAQKLRDPQPLPPADSHTRHIAWVGNRGVYPGAPQGGYFAWRVDTMFPRVPYNSSQPIPARPSALGGFVGASEPSAAIASAVSVQYTNGSARQFTALSPQRPSSLNAPFATKYGDPGGPTYGSESTGGSVTCAAGTWSLGVAGADLAWLRDPSVSVSYMGNQTVNLTTGLAGGRGEATYEVATARWQDPVNCRDLWVAPENPKGVTSGGVTSAKDPSIPSTAVPVMLRVAQRDANALHGGASWARSQVHRPSGVKFTSDSESESDSDFDSGYVTGDAFAIQCLEAPLAFGCGGRVECFMYEGLDRLDPKLAVLDSPVFALPADCES